MSSKTKIIVLHKKEVLYTIVFAVFSIMVIGLLVYMFSTGNKPYRFYLRIEFLKLSDKFKSETGRSTGYYSGLH